MSNRSLFLLWVGLALLVVNSAYLSVTSDPGLFHLGNLLLHPALGLVLFWPFARWWWRRRRPLCDLGALLLTGSAAAGLLLVFLGNRGELRFLLWVHVGLALGGLLTLLAAFASASRGRLWKLSIAGLALAAMVPTAATLRRGGSAAGEGYFVNPPAPADLAEQAMGGTEGPFYPSALSTSNGALLPAEAFARPQSCGRAGCHPDVVAEWSSSAHRFSGLDNPWYRETYRQMREQRGEGAARWCGGCHTPALLVAGMTDQPPEMVADTAVAEVGVSCTVCHGVSRVGSSMGQADFELAVAPLHTLATSDNRLAQMLHDLLVRLDPEPHRRTYSKPFHSGPLSAEFCSTCHRAFTDEPLGERYFPAMDDYTPWQFYSPAGQSISTSIRYPEPRTCVDCHMPQVESDDAGHRDGKVRSHRFAAANTALPALHGDEKQLQAVTDFLQDAVTIDIFAMSKGRPLQEARKVTRYHEIYAPLDRVPATLRRGESTRFYIMLLSHNVGHMFPGGKNVLKDCWLEVKAVDDGGRTVFWSGRMDDEGNVDPGAHFLGGMWGDRHGQRVDGYDVWKITADILVNQIEPHAGEVARYLIDVPPEAGDRITLTAQLHYRKFRPQFTQQAFSALDMQAPELPVVTMAKSALTLSVIDAGAELPDMEHPASVPEVDFDRWLDFGYGLASSRNLRLGRTSIRKALELKPEDAGGWATLGNLEWAVGDIPAAREALDRALAIEPDNVRARYFLGLSEVDDSRFESASEYLSAVSELYPRDPLLLRELGRAFLLNADYVAAAEALTRALAVDPAVSQTQFMMALTQRALGNVELSRRHELLSRRFTFGFQFDSSTRDVVAAYLKTDPHADLERQELHEHDSLPLAELETKAPAGRTP